MKGQCLCGDVQFHFHATPTGVSACHCPQCRKWTGHYLASVEVPQDDLILDQGAESIAWYPSSQDAERGFCVICGSSLFWRQIDPDATHVSVAAGALDSPTTLLTTRHIFTELKGDYYALPDDAPHFPKGPNGPST